MTGVRGAHPIKVIIAVLGLDQHEVGSLTVSKILSDAGMEVVYLGRFNTGESVAEAAISEDVDVVGISCHSWEYLEYAKDLVDRLALSGISVVFGGSVITAGDAEFLRQQGAAAIFGPQCNSADIIRGIEAVVRGDDQA